MLINNPHARDFSNNRVHIEFIVRHNKDIIIISQKSFTVFETAATP